MKRSAPTHTKIVTSQNSEPPEIKSEITPPPEHQAPLHAAAGFAAMAAFVGVGALILSPHLKTFVFVLYAVVGAGIVPIALYAFVQLRRIFLNDSHYRQAIGAMERRWNMDINGDGVIGEPEQIPDDRYTRTLMFWIHSGNTKRDDTVQAIGIDAQEWQQYRDKALRLKDANGNPVFLKAKRQGGGYGLIVSARFRQRWPEVEDILKG